MTHILEPFFAVIGVFAFVLALFVRFRYYDYPYGSWQKAREDADAYEAWKIFLWGIVVFAGILAFGLLMGLLGLLR
jgi:hypothetical protein